MNEERLEEINRGLLERQMELQDKVKEYEQWFVGASNNVGRMESRIDELERALKQIKDNVTWGNADESSFQAYKVAEKALSDTK